MRISDWSSDVCSSDLIHARVQPDAVERPPILVRPVVAAFLLGQYRTSPSFCVSCPGARDSPPPSIANRAARRKRSLTRTPRRLPLPALAAKRSEEHTSELQSLMRI